MTDMTKEEMIALYRGQWERLLTHAPEIEAFIAAIAALLATKP